MYIFLFFRELLLNQAKDLMGTTYKSNDKDFVSNYLTFFCKIKFFLLFIILNVFFVFFEECSIR